jgi:hypothetical protein
MSSTDTIVAVYETHTAAEAAIRKIAESGFDMKHFSIVGKGYHTEEKVIGFYSAGDRIQFWGRNGALWGGLWGLLFGGMMLTLPVVGPIVVVGSLAGVIYAAVVGAVEGAVVVGGLSALGAALASIGVPKQSVVKYEQAILADHFVVTAHGTATEMARVKVMLEESGPAQLDMHDATAAAA